MGSLPLLMRVIDGRTVLFYMYMYRFAFPNILVFLHGLSFNLTGSLLFLCKIKATYLLLFLYVRYPPLYRCVKNRLTASLFRLFVSLFCLLVERFEAVNRKRYI